MPLNIEQASKQLGVREDYLRKLLRDGKIPGEKIDGQWTIKKKNIDAYLSKYTLPQGYVDAYHAAKKAGVIKNTIINSIKAGRLKAKKRKDRWIIKEKDLETYMQRNDVPSGYISLKDAVKKLNRPAPTVYQTLKRHDINIRKTGKEVIFLKEDFKKLKAILETATRGRNAECASILFRKFGHAKDSGISGPFLEARTGKFKFGRKVLGQIPLANIRPESIENAKKKLIKIINDQGIFKIHDKTGKAMK